MISEKTQEAWTEVMANGTSGYKKKTWGKVLCHMWPACMCYRAKVGKTAYITCDVAYARSNMQLYMHRYCAGSSYP